MANLKKDLLNNLGNDKYYDELELARLASDPNMVYKDKIEKMSAILKGIASIDLATQLIGKYFPEEQEPTQQQDGPAPEQPKTHPGQTHGE
jgi:hypothetical protein